MPIPLLRPLTIGQIIDRAIRLYRNHFWTFLSIVAVVQVPVALVQVINTLIALTEDITLIALSGLGTILIILVSVLANQVATAALARSVADVYLGRESSFAAAYRSVLPLIVNLFVTLIVTALIGIGLLIVAVIIPLAGWVVGMAVLFFFSGAIVPLVGPILVLERRAGFDVLRRGWDLARRRFWPVVGYIVVLGLLVLAITAGPSALLSYLSIFVWSGFDPAAPMTAQNMPQAPAWATIVQVLSNVTIQTLFLPIQLAAASVLYFDLRVRTEGLDLELVLARQNNEAVDLDALLANAPAPRQDQLVGSDEWSKFASLGCVFWIAVIGFISVVGGLVAALAIMFSPF